MLHPVTKTLLFLFENQLLDQVSMDSRSLGNSEKTVFFAIKGPNFDGHDFIEEVLLQKVQHFVVEKTPEKFKMTRTSDVPSKGTRDAKWLKNSL